jgi:RimJ/RimL family protein N-acetyltransferase
MDTLDEFIDCKCPHCGHEGCFRRDVAGQIEECPECTATLIVPKDGAKLARMLPLPITRPRLVLRRLHMNDWKDLVEVLGDDEIYTFVDATPKTEEQLVKWLEEEQWIKLTTPETTFCLAIEHGSDKKVIGAVYFNFIRGDRKQGSFSIYVSRKFQRQGLGTEALEGLLDFCFNGISLHRLAASCDSQNNAAIRMLNKVGLRREGEFLEDHMVGEAWGNTMYYALLAKEYAGGGPSD